MSDIVLQAEGLEKTHHQGESSLTIFKDISLSVTKGEIVALVGQSGAGKSTLLQMVGLLDKPTAGFISIDGEDVSRLYDQKRTMIRRRKIGFVYQFHFLQPEFSAIENVMIPQIIAGIPKDQAYANVKPMLERLGLGNRIDHRPARLSGGEQQRVAIARALANQPSLLLADEPTGNLDPQTSDEVFHLLIEQARDAGIGALIATHNMDLARRMDRILVLEQGQLKAA